ncbi:MAG: 50S ribosomal protein L4 [Alphaproteobacteria bacterium]|nr:50S ribosomal protein L4 [Alphaproteobacteria bacterium]
MKKPVITLDGAPAGDIELDDAIFGLEPRADILHRVVNWQLSKRRAGTRRTMTRAEINRTKKKIYKQKGTGQARHGSARVPQFRGGGRAMGPVVRSHEFDLPKKVRRLGLKLALSSKARADKLVIVEAASVAEAKTKLLASSFKKLGLSSALIVDGAQVDAMFERAVRNLVHFQALPSQGLNVYDILKRDTLVLTKAAVAQIAERLQ